MSKSRLDTALVSRGLFKTREKARSAIMAGNIRVDGVREDKPGAMISPDTNLEVKGDPHPYVSRGGLKLARALKSFNIQIQNRVCADIGASTGGFTDCMLKNGAGKVYAIDVGYGQLAWELRNDSRVICMERTNIRYVTPERIGEKIDFVAVDVSFISIALILPALAALIREGGEMVCLVKPQFEAGREKVGKKGVVRDREVHRDVLLKICHALHAREFEVMGLDHSPIRGPEGNIEYLVFAVYKKYRDPDNRSWEDEISRVVEQAHANLKCTGQNDL